MKHRLQIERLIESFRSLCELRMSHLHGSMTHLVAEWLACMCSNRSAKALMLVRVRKTTAWNAAEQEEQQPELQ